MGGLLEELQEQFHCHPSGHWDIISVGGAMNLLQELLRLVQFSLLANEFCSCKVVAFCQPL
jgi:hypothetical protein